MRLLIVSDSPALASGQARMARELAERFTADGVETLVAGWGHFQAVRDVLTPYEILHLDKAHPESIGEILAEIKPEIVLTMGDPWEFRFLAEQRAAGAPWLLTGYLNIEHTYLPSHLEQVLDGFDAIRTTANFGANAIGRVGVSAVHLGVNPKIFKPGPRPKTILGTPIDDRFVIFVNAQNTQRKNLATAMLALEKALKTDPSLLMVLNTQPSATGGANLLDEITRLGLEGSVLFVPQNRGPWDTGVTDQHLAAMYQAADCVLFTSIAEGFCLPALEAMACGTLVVAPDIGPFPELLEDRGILYAAGSPLQGEHRGWIHVVHPTSVAVQGIHAAVLRKKVFTSSGKQDPKKDLALQFAQSKTWDACYRQIADMIGTVEPVPRWPRAGGRAASGLSIDHLTRTRARQVARPNRFAVVKLGGLGDMLMATRVIREAAKAYGKQAVVFANQFPEVFRPMPEVDEVVEIRSAAQGKIVRSIADEFPLCLDLRVISRIYGYESPEATPLAKAFAWMTDQWTESLSRVETLGKHVTALMLDSLGLPSDNLQPVYELRGNCHALSGRNIKDFVAILPGTGALGPLKRPQAEWWEALIASLAPQPVIQIGAQQDDLFAGVLDGRGLLLPQAAEILEHADQVIGVESGLMHLTRAVRGPDAARAICLFGPTPISAYGYREHLNLSHRLCQPCFWGPTWLTQTCAMAARTCLNLPHWQEVRALVTQRHGEAQSAYLEKLVTT